MNVVSKIKTLLKEGDLYSSQGLMNEGLAKYEKAASLIKGSKQLQSKENLIKGISNKIKLLQKKIDKVEKASTTPEVSEKVQTLIKNMFSFSAADDDDTVALDGAIALAKFGQYESALSEFNKLLEKDSLKVVAAKNIIRCYMALSSVDDAIAEYEKWLSEDIFPEDQLKKVGMFFKGILKKEGIDKSLPKAKTQADDKKAEITMSDIPEPVIEGLELEDDETKDEEEILDINAIGIKMKQGAQKGQLIEFNVSFQSGNVISLLISHKDNDLLKNFEMATTLDDVQFYSPIAIFNGTGVVSAITKIESGPRQGDYSIDIKVSSN